MKGINKERWDEKEIKKAARIMAEAEKNKSILVRVLDEVLHWLLLIIVLFGNLLMAAFIVIISEIVDTFYLYMILIIVAISFGMMVEMPLKDIEKLSRHKHMFARVMLIILTAVNIFIMVGMKNTAEHFLEAEFPFNAFVAGAVYGVCFLLPHFLGWVVKEG